MEKSIMQQTAEHIELEDKESEERNMDDERVGMPEHICPVCGKVFIPAPYHRYKDNDGLKVCSYTCSLKAPKSKKKHYVSWGVRHG